MRSATDYNEGDLKLQDDKTIKTAIIAGIFAALFVLALHFLFSIVKGINDLPYNLSFGQRPRYMNLGTFGNRGNGGHFIDILGFPGNKLGIILTSIFYGLLFGIAYYVWLKRKNRLLRWTLFKPPSQQKSPHSNEKEKDDSTFCRLRITTCCLMPLLRNAKHRIYYYHPQYPNKIIHASQLAHVRCPLCGAQNWHVRAWSSTATLPIIWARSLQKYKGVARQLSSKMECADEEE